MKLNNTPYLYLVGQISVNAIETYLWRERFIECFDEEADIVVINPCNSEFNRSITDNNYEKHTDVYYETGVDLLPSKDKNYVDMADIIVANLTLYDPERVMIGSFYELAWAKEDATKSVIGIFDGNPEKDMICNHPFVRNTIHAWVKTEIDAAELVKEFFL